MSSFAIFGEYMRVLSTAGLCPRQELSPNSQDRVTGLTVRFGTEKRAGFPCDKAGLMRYFFD